MTPQELEAVKARAGIIAAQMGVPMKYENSPLLEQLSGFMQGFVKPTVEAAPRVLGTAVAGMATMPVAGMGGLSKLFTTGDLNQANSVIENIMNAGNFIQTPQQEQSMDYLNYAMKPIEMAGEGWGLIGKLADAQLQKTGMAPTYLEPTLGSMGTAAGMFSLPEILARAKVSPIDAMGPLKNEIGAIGDIRRNSLTEQAGMIPKATTTVKLRSHPDFKAAKAGDPMAAINVARDLTTPEGIEFSRQLGPDVIYVPVSSIEKSGNNKIPIMVANHHAELTGGTVATDIVQVNKVFHTDANAMSRLMNRAEFDGPVVKGGRYVLVDDTGTMGGTLAELAHHIQEGGANVDGIIYLANATRGANIAPTKAIINEIKGRFGNAIEKEYGIHPEALTRPEAEYLLKFRTVDALRNRTAQERKQGSSHLSAVNLPEQGRLTSFNDKVIAARKNLKGGKK